MPAASPRTTASTGGRGGHDLSYVGTTPLGGHGGEK